jgi:hypothetical protein|tara:strand:+ start:73 stop:330 length:258 start_codon:yes stop_codon:yes gene_type:complete
MNITFWKNNKIDQEYQIDIDTIVTDFIKSKYQTEDWLNYPFERRLNMFLMDINYGTYEPFTNKQWGKIYDTYQFHKNLNKYKDFI